MTCHRTRSTLLQGLGSKFGRPRDRRPAQWETIPATRIETLQQTSLGLEDQFYLSQNIL
jgi:hypothetical protein